MVLTSYTELLVFVFSSVCPVYFQPKMLTQDTASQHSLVPSPHIAPPGELYLCSLNL